MKTVYRAALPVMLILTNFFYDAYGQMTQYHIGSSGNELATCVRYHASDQSVIIAGYKYDYSGGTVSNCQAIVMKIYHGGFIAWQKTFGVAGKNNMIQDMI